MYLDFVPECFGVQVESGARQIVGDVANLELLSNPDPVVVVNSEMKRFVDRTHRVIDLPPQEYGRLADETCLPEALKIEWFCGIALDDTTLLVNMITLPVHHPDVRVVVEVIQHLRKSSRHVGVIRIEVSHHFAHGYGKSLVDRMRLATVFFRSPDDPTVMPFQYCNRLVGGTAIHHDRFDVRIIL